MVPGSSVLAGAVLTALDAAHADLFGPDRSLRPEYAPDPVPVPDLIEEA
jgi:hypothetical protein